MSGGWGGEMLMLPSSSWESGTAWRVVNKDVRGWHGTGVHALYTMSCPGAFVSLQLNRSPGHKSLATLGVALLVPSRPWQDRHRSAQLSRR